MVVPSWFCKVYRCVMPTAHHSIITTFGGKTILAFRRIVQIKRHFCPMSVGAHPRSSPHLDAASHLGTAFFLLIPVEIFCLYTAHMCSIVKHISHHLSPLDAVRRVL